jgi:multidrug efflux pump subunit AcrB
VSVQRCVITLELFLAKRQVGKTLVRAILDGAQQIALPSLISTLCICIVFVPVLMLSGAAKFLFTPLAMAVVFAMLTSYLLTRTMVPTLVHYLLRAGGRSLRGSGPSLARLVPLIGNDFFPYVDSGQIRLHVRCPTGTRIKEAERIFADVEREIRSLIPQQELNSILDNIGLPSSGINLAFSDSSTVGDGDGEILISLTAGHRPTPEYTRLLRERLAAKFPASSSIFRLPILPARF